MTEAPPVVIELRGVTKVYKQGKVDVYALRGLDLVVREGEFTAICGPSGSGKSTALNLIGALDEPTSGTVTLEGKDLSTLSRRGRSHLRRDRIGFVFQAYNLMPVLSAYENAESVLALQGARDRRERVMALLEEVGLKGLEHRRPDEPTANVDSETAERLLDIMEKLNREHGVTFVFSTHDPRVMERARRVVMLVDGRVASDETKGGPESASP